MSTEIGKAGDDNEIRLSYNLVTKLIGLSCFLLMFGLFIYIQLFLDPTALTKPIFYVLVFFLGMFTLLLVELFTTGYRVDSTGVHKHSISSFGPAAKPSRDIIIPRITFLIQFTSQLFSCGAISIIETHSSGRSHR